MKHAFRSILSIAGCLLFLLLAPSQEAHATHNMGADLSWECLGGNTYLIRLVVYRDCEGAELQSTQNIHIKSDSCGVASSVQVANRTSVLELSPLCPAQQPLSTCRPNGILPGVQQHVYELTYTFPQQCPDWNLHWRLCCRNYAITNSVISTQTRMYIEGNLNNLDVVCNNSPYFTVPPVPYICKDNPFIFNNGAVDPDGDSLVFELVNPLDFGNGAAFNIPYMGGFSVGYPMSTSPPGAFNFDPVTGQIAFTPDAIQQGIVSILVKEYRNGQLIGTTMRDLQMVVIECLNDPPSLSAPYNISGGQLNGNVFSVCAGNTLSFDIDGEDVLNPNDNLTMTGDAGNITGVTYNINNGPGNSLIGSFSWPTTLADTGIYYVNIALEDDGCPIIGSANIGFTIYVNPGVILPPQFVNYCPSDTTPVTLTAQTTGTGTYTWAPDSMLVNPSTGPSAQIIPPDGPISISTIYNDGIGCNVYESFVLQPDAELLIPDDTVRICVGDSITLSSITYSGSATDPVSWAPPININGQFTLNPTVWPTSNQTYQINISTLSCDYESSVFVIVDTTPVLNPFVTEEICQGDSVQLVPSGSGLDFATFSWSPVLGLSDPNIPNPIASPTTSRTYTLTVSNSCGSAAEDVDVVVYAPLSLSLNAEDVSCNGSSDGSIQAVPFGGSGNAAYVWLPPVGTPGSATVNNLPPGSYTVVGIDDAGCEATATVTVNEPPVLVVSIDSAIDVGCYGEATGELEVSATGGTPGYSFALNGSSTFLNVTSFVNLPQGPYTVTVMDSKGCTATSAPVNINQPTIPLEVVIDSVQSTNCVLNLGFIQISGNGGAIPYEFSADGGTTWSLNGAFGGLPPGLYTMMVRDYNGCMASAEVEIKEANDPFLVIDSTRDASCYGVCDGFLSFSPAGGTPPYLYLLDANALSDTFVNNLCPGYHEIAVADFFDCGYSLSFVIEEPDSLYTQAGALSDVSCNGGLDGSILALAFGGTEPYEYDISPGLGGFTNNNQFEDLVAGTYTVTVQDSNECEADFVVDILEPAPLLATPLNKLDISCFGEQDGSVEMNATGGTKPYKYSLNGSPFVLNNVFTGLAAGTYTFDVQDANGCLASANVTIIEPAPLAVTVTDINDVTCFGIANGSVTVAGSGGTPAYEFAFEAQPFGSSPILTGMAAGTYVIVIRDGNGCMAETAATLNEPDALIGSGTSQDISCYGENDGSAEVDVVGGTPAYQYLWNTGETNSTVNNLPPGNYDCIITDANNCQYSISVEVIEPPLMEFDSISYVDASCYDFADGEAFARAVGGTPSLTYVWTDSVGTDSIASGMAAGTYTVTVTDSLGCSISQDFEIGQPTPIVPELVDSDPAFCGLANGSVTIDVTGGFPEYEIFWNTTPPQTGPVAVDLFGGPDDGVYTALIVDSVGCETTFTYQVELSSQPIADFTTDFIGNGDTLILDQAGINFLNRSQFAFSYGWDFGDGQTSTDLNPIHVYHQTGTYTVELVAYDLGRACPDTAEYTFTLIPPGAIYVPNAFTPNYDEFNGYFHPIGVGVVEVEMNIWDRWGGHIITLNSMADRWDGTKNGEPCQEGVYVFVVNAVLNDGTTFYKAGTVTLIR
ncbi:PKD domain-containing protein [Pontibacter sp. G13]|uniref:PKD domain-containing protein n=1 Tax=Pontibacter sp. G13 TaxID=3074898 RepID=UPI002889A233|nr:PKD domain-containing protein [Pontibacter sp. G13]WNJ20744.1 gliding motility-associated C-terminal domain-containing protein [Pontibacter sp. G13]